MLALTQLLTNIVLPNLKTVQVSQMEQIAANDRLEQAIEELREHLNAQFTQLSAQLTALRVELAATQALLKAQRAQEGGRTDRGGTLVH